MKLGLQYTFVITMLTAAGSLFSQEILRLDPSFDQIAAPNATLEKVAGGFDKWTEGPVWTRNGTLLFAEIPANNIVQWIPGQKASVFMHPSGYTGSTPFKGGEPGSNGMTLDKNGRVTVAGHARRNVWRLETLKGDGQITVLADSYEGKKLNSPNDVAYRSDGSLYFTDPPYGLETQQDNDPKKELKVNGVYRIPGALQQKAGAPPAREKLQLVIKDLARPNGLVFSPDEKFLYVAESGRRVWLRYKVQADGSLTDGSLFLDASSDKAQGGPDGMRVDQKGNIYSSGPGGVWIISPEGKHIGTFKLPERVANVAWGDKDGKTLYICASTTIYSIKLKIAGVRN